jgi:peptide/nickel transport system substrate-binding protein
VRSSRRPFVGLFAALATLALLAAACGGSSKKSSSTATTAAPSVPKGGTLVIGAEQEPDCVDWIGSCSGSSWGTWIMNVTTMPRPYNIVKQGDGWVYQKSDLLSAESDLQTSPKQVVTYHINPKAVWSDGQPITATDFKYTWDQVAHGANIYDTTGYANIESVDDSVATAPKVTFATPYGDWKTLFGGQYAVLPSHLLQGKDRNKEMANGYTFSGGPFKIESWQKGTSATLVRNDAYWGTKPNLDKVVFRFITNTSAEFAAFKAGETSVIYPQPQPDAVDQIKAGVPGAKSVYTADTGNLEALWFNNGKAPFDDERVRQAWAYAIDRPALVDRLFGALNVHTPMQTLIPPIQKAVTDTTAWSNYTKDMTKVDSLMTAAGWTKGSDGIWAKGGKPFTVEFKTTTGNKRRELTQQILQEQLKAAGFNFTINNQKSGDLFGSQLPKDDFQVALYAQVTTSLGPNNCNLFCSKNIPVAPKFTGQNWQRVKIPAVDPLLVAVDTALDQNDTATNEKQADKILAAANVALPLDPLPNILLWNTKVVGPLGDNPAMGPFWNLAQWGVTS